MQVECMENKIAFMAMHCKTYQCFTMHSPMFYVCFTRFYNVPQTNMFEENFQYLKHFT